MKRVTVVIVMMMMMMMMMVAPVSADECEGFVTVDGCVGIDQYNSLFGVDVLAETPSLAFPGLSVVEAYEYLGIPLLPTVEAVDRPRDFMGEPLPTIREVIEGKLWAV